MARGVKAPNALPEVKNGWEASSDLAECPTLKPIASPISNIEQTGELSHLRGRTRGQALDHIGLPGQTDVTDALLALLYRRNEWIEPAEAYAKLAEHLGLDKSALALTMSDGRNHWQNRVQWARKELVDRGLLDNSRRGFWKLYSQG
ncbi:MAG: winged helix-turn-helix domain-containing protein [Novosphingobium sp.]